MGGCLVPLAMVSCPALYLLDLFCVKRCVLESGKCSLGMEQYTFLPDVYFDFVASHTHISSLVMLVKPAGYPYSVVDAMTCDLLLLLVTQSECW